MLYPKVLEGWINDQLENGNRRVVFEKVASLSFEAIDSLQTNCKSLQNIMHLENWWEKLFSLKYPITYARYQNSIYKSNACIFLSSKTIDYKLLFQKLNLNNFKLVNPFAQLCLGTSIGDEFGIGSIYMKNKNELTTLIHTNQSKFNTWGKWMGCNQTNKGINMNQIHGISLQSRVILEVFAPNGRELILMNPNDEEDDLKDPSCYAINYPDSNWLDLPPDLTGDPSLCKPLIAATEKNYLHQNIHTNGTFAVYLKRFKELPHNLLIFDQLYEHEFQDPERFNELHTNKHYQLGINKEQQEFKNTMKLLVLLMFCSITCCSLLLMDNFMQGQEVIQNHCILL
jgi:hypothetical protein